MSTTFSAVLFLVLVLSGTKKARSEVTDFVSHLKAFVERRDHVVGKDALLHARDYIHQAFETTGLRAEEQRFSTSVFAANRSTVQVGGVNIIGEMPGKNTSAPCLIIGVDYDTGSTLSPLWDNGAGVAVMLETINQLKNHLGKGSRHLQGCVYFVAFDVNSHKYDPPGEDITGVESFLDEWLPKKLLDKPIQGAFLLSSFTNINKDPKSQTLLDGFDQAFPSAYQTIMEDDQKGNFIAFLTRNQKKFLPLTASLTGNFRKNRKQNYFRLQEMVLSDGAPMSIHMLDFLNRQSVLQFWTADVIPATLLSDLGITRKNSNPTCFKSCSVDEFLTEEVRTVMEWVTMGITSTILDLQAPDSVDGSTTVTPNAVTTTTQSNTTAPVTTTTGSSKSPSTWPSSTVLYFHLLLLTILTLV